MRQNAPWTGLGLFAVLATCVCLLYSSGLAGGEEGGGYRVLVDATSGATGMRGRYAEEEATDSALLYYDSGRSYLRLKSYKAALLRFDKAIEVDPEFAEAHYLRARTYLGLGEHKKALEDFSRSIELNPKDKRLLGGCFFSRGVLLTSMGEHLRALEDLDRAVGLLPGYAIIYRKRAEAHRALGQDEKALEDLETAVSRDPNLATVLEPEIRELKDRL